MPVMTYCGQGSPVRYDITDRVKMAQKMNQNKYEEHQAQIYLNTIPFL